MKDWGSTDACGPWTKPEDFYNDDGSLKMFKSFYLVSDNKPCDMNLHYSSLEFQKTMTKVKRRARRNKINKIFNNI